MIVPQAYCPICTDLFFEAKPRILPCGHSVCENCLRIILKRGQFKCFYCKKPIIEGNATTFPCFINYGLWNIVKAIVAQNKTISVSKKDFEEQTKEYRSDIKRILADSKKKSKKMGKLQQGRQANSQSQEKSPNIKERKTKRIQKSVKADSKSQSQK